MTGKYWSLVAGAACAAFLHGPSSALAQSLGSAQSFAILGGSAVNANGTGSVINGDVGVSPGTAITGFPPGTGAIVLPPFSFLHSADAAANNARADTLTLYNFLAAAACTPLSSDQLDGQNLGPGCHSGGALDLASGGTLTLSGPGIYIFQAASSLTANTLSHVVLKGGADPCNVFWQVTSLATLNGATFVGTVVAQAGVHLGTGVSLTGRALAGAGGDVTLAGTDTVGGCGGAAGVPVPVAPTLSKAFSPFTIDPNVPSTLTITLSNPNTSVATLTAALTDTLPANVNITAAPTVFTDCGGTCPVGAVGLGTTVTLPAGCTIPAGTSSTPGTCKVTVTVTSATPGGYVNTLAAGALQTDNGNNAAAAEATLTVNPPLVPGAVAPTVGKSFDLATINAGDTSILTIILSNSSNDTNVTNAAFTDTLPTGVVIAASPVPSNGCGGSLTATAGTGTISLSGGFIPFGSGTTAGTCTVTVPVTAAVGGIFLNTLTIGTSVTSATLTVNAVAPTLSKFFSPSVTERRDPTLTIMLCNANSSPADLLAPLTDFLPDGVVIAATPNASTTCPGSGLVAATPGGTTVTLPLTRSIPASGCCTVSVNVITTRLGSFVNKLPVNSLQTTNGNNAAVARATLTVNRAVPMLSGWGMIMLIALLAVVGFATMRRQAM